MSTAERLRAEGVVEGQARLLLKQLAIRFGEISAERRSAVENATPEQIDRWSTRLIQGAPTLDDVFS